MIKKYLNKYKDDFEKCKKDLKNIKTCYKLIPNLLTISRPIGMIPANILFFTGNVVPAIILTGTLLLTDLFDGKLARLWNVQSKLGADLDAVSDKIMFLGMAIPLIINNPLMLFNIIPEGIIAGINIYGRVKGLDTKTVYSGKIKTWLLSLTLCYGYINQFFSISTQVLKALIGVTAATQIVVIKDYVKEFKKMDLSKQIEIKKDNKGDECELENKRSRSDLLEELRKERTFYLGICEPNKVYTGKKKQRTLAQAKKNN